MICNNHFKEQDFLYRVTDNKLILKKDAVPCITKSTKHKKRYIFLCKVSEIICLYCLVYINNIKKYKIMYNYNFRLYQEMTDFHANNASNSTMKLMKEELNVGKL